MPGMPHSTDFLTPPGAEWPLPHPLPGVALFSTQFDPQRLDADAFARHGVAAPENIARSVAKRRAEYLAGRLCARAALQQLNGRAECPTLGADRAPQWPAGTCGSITHSDGWAAAIVARQSDWQGLGLDAETLLDDARAERLQGEILTPAESQRLDPAQRALCVTLTFSLKEALFKALYPLVQKRFYFEHAEVLNWDTNGHARLRLLCDLSARWHNGSELDAQYARFDGRLLSLVSVAAD
ncbi:MAG: Enterobactin synthase component D [Stenotrophomonas maltophilia]|nr:MAG: Enterobactin synthase component D [Stenotrophomonas maltophilia]